MDTPCQLCGHVGPVEHHHVTGRSGPAGPYLDPALTSALCRPCHNDEHVVLRRRSLSLLPASHRPIAHRLERLAVHCSLLAEAGRSLALDPSATRALAGLASESAAAICQEVLL